MGLFGFLKKKEPTSSNEIHTSQTQKSPIFANVSPGNNGIVPIEKRIKGKAPSCDGLYPHEILVMSYAPKYCDCNNEFQGFWWYSYGIKDVQAILNSLCKRGYIKLGSISEAISLEKLPVIKEELQKHGLKTSGKKADLVARLIESVPEKELESVFERRPYILTESGEKTLHNFEWIPYIHHHGIEDLDIWNLTEMVQTPPYMKYRDKIWGYLNKRGMEHAMQRDFGLYRNCKFAMSEFVAEEGKDDIAFSILCEVAAYDLSGLSNGFKAELIKDTEYLKMSASFYFPYEKSIATIRKISYITTLS